MALWQVGFFVLPNRCLNLLSTFNVSDEYSFDDALYWEKEKINPSEFREINNILSETKSWANYITLYGNENSNRFEVISKSNIVESVSFRIDFTSNYDPVLNGIIEFCILKGLIILDEELNAIPLNFQVIKSVIENAPQVKRYNQLSKNDRSSE